jgi:hypothetical protein
MIMALIALIFVLLPLLIALSRSAINDFRDGWGEREIKTTKIQYGGEMFLEIIKTWTNLTQLWRTRMSFKNIVWQKQPVEITWKLF